LIVKYALWTVQILLALVFLFSGSMKFIMPVEEMTAGSPLPGWFIQFIGLCEVLGAFGLILPGLTGIKPGLTPLAAAGLVVIMIGATVLTALGMGGEGVPPATAVIPLVVGLLAAFVAYGRWNLVPQGERAREEEYATAR
jgi:uncharacterized membrane protein YphA (DoxX/SURF4 family)